MNKTFSELWSVSKVSIRGHWGMSILVAVVSGLITIAASRIQYIGFLSGLLLFPLNVGVMLYFLRLARQQNPQFENMFEPFHQYGRWLWGYIRVTIFIFLWTLLLIIPGIIASFRYAMTYWIMLDDPEIPVKDAMEKSSRLMYGHKARLFGYGLIFSLLFFASIFTLGIALFWLVPWSILFIVHFYNDLAMPEDATAENPELPNA